MIAARTRLAGVGRLLCRLFLVALMLFSIGCDSAPKKRWSLFGESAKDRQLREQVEADSFPSAKQAGL